ncbi:4,6-dehydratase LegB [soil metagenome]
MKIAVTGSGGFIGSYLLPAIKKEGHEVIELTLEKGFDVLDWNSMKSIPDFDKMIHLAAVSYVPDSFIIPYEFYKVNILSTLNVLEVCRLRKAGMIFMSSYVYGAPDYLPIDEKHPIKAFNPYSQSKLSAEQICTGYSRDFNMDVVVLRPFNLYGFGQRDNFLIPTIIKQAQSGKIILKDPNPKRDMLYIEDFIEAVIKCCSVKGNALYNVGYGKSFTINEMAEAVCKAFNQNINLEFTGEKRPGEVMNTIADISAITSATGWKPKTSLEKGIKLTVENFLK